MRKRIPLRDVQAAINAYAPDGGMVRPPAFMNQKARAAPTEKRKHPEDDLQIECCGYLDKLRATLYWATPNHIYVRNPSGAALGYLAKQKRMGMRKGACDLNILFRDFDGKMSLCLAELKIGSNAADTDQDHFINQAIKLGATSGVVKSLEELKELLRRAGHPIACELKSFGYDEAVHG